MKHPHHLFAGVFFFLFLFFLPHIEAAEEWRTIKTDHFVVFYTGENVFARKVGDQAEHYYNSIAHDMGYARYSKFWSWNNRVSIYLYPDKQEYLKNTKSPDWTEGLADYEHRAIASYTGSADFTENVLPHEIAHLIFRDFVGFEGDVPLWLEEGLAQWWTSGHKNDMIQKNARHLYQRNAILSLEDITSFDIRKIVKIPYVKKVTARDGTPALLIINPEQLINTFYLQSASLVGFMRERYGQDRFTRFCRELRDGKSLDRALKSAYAEYFRDAKDLEKAWREFLAS